MNSTSTRSSGSACGANVRAARRSAEWQPRLISPARLPSSRWTCTSTCRVDAGLPCLVGRRHEQVHWSGDQCHDERSKRGNQSDEGPGENTQAVRNGRFVGACAHETDSFQGENASTPNSREFGEAVRMARESGVHGRRCPWHPAPPFVEYEVALSASRSRVLGTARSEGQTAERGANQGRTTASVRGRKSRSAARPRHLVDAEVARTSIVQAWRLRSEARPFGNQGSVLIKPRARRRPHKA